MFRPNALKARLRAGKRALGCWTVLGAPAVIELLALCGFDYLLLDQEHGFALGREVAVAPGHEGEDHRAEIPPPFGQDVFVARRALIVEAAFQEAGFHQRGEAARQHVGRDAEALLELIEAGVAVQGIPEDQDAPPFAHALQAAGDRTLGVADTLFLHEGNLGK